MQNVGSSLTLNDLLTVVIPVKNEALNLPACLATIADLTHKVVVDSQSSDATQQIARDAGCDVLDFEWDGKFPKKRNWVLQTYAFKTPWVLFLDADERVTEAFKEELAHVLPTTMHNCFWIFYDNWFMGRILRHGDPVRKTALLRIGTGGYERLKEGEKSDLCIEIHEHILAEGTSGQIMARLEHHDMRSLTNYYAKHNEYASWEVTRYLQLSGKEDLTRRQRIKYRFIRNPFFPLAYFIATYLFRGGFLDGWAGFYFAVGKCFYFYQIQAKLRHPDSK